MTNTKTDLVFHKIHDAKCDFCNVTRRVVTSVNETTYICHVCSVKINKHTRMNWRVVAERKVTEKK
mgnify:CR=1 FL=1